MFLQASVILLTGGEYLTDPPDLEQIPPPGPGADLPEPGNPPRTTYTPLGPGTPPRPSTPSGTRYPPRTSYTPQDQVHPPGPGTPPRYQVPPWDQVHPPGPGTPPEPSILRDKVNERAVRILLECNLVFFCLYYYMMLACQ